MDSTRFTHSGRRTLAVLAVLTLTASLGCSSLKRLAYAGFGRDGWQQPEAVIEALAIAPGSRVADLGAGGGYFTFDLAEAAGAEGVVYAVDIDADMLAALDTRAAEEGVANLRTVQALAEDAGLPEGQIDLVFTCNTYHHLPDRETYFRRLRSAFAPDGRLAVVDFDGRSWFARWFGHYTPPEDIRSELAAAGYALQEQHEFLSRQSFQVFAPTAEASR